MVANHWRIRQIVCSGVTSMFAREVIFQMLAHALQRCDQTHAEMPALER